MAVFLYFYNYMHATYLLETYFLVLSSTLHLVTCTQPYSSCFTECGKLTYSSASSSASSCQFYLLLLYSLIFLFPLFILYILRSLHVFQILHTPTVDFTIKIHAALYPSNISRNFTFIFFKAEREGVYCL